MTPSGELAAWPASLNARFTPSALLGRGNFGTVFDAVDATRQARVAVKVLRADRPSALQAFKREFRALTDLAHDNLVALHELGREGDAWFLVMESVEGHELLEALSSAPLPRVRHVFAQVALGLSFLHASGRVHRDLKPSNVRVTPQGRAVVLDFGLALDGPPEAGDGLVGAAAYMAPEQAAGADASGASDVYALGVMLCEVLSGKRPFEGSALEVLSAKRSREATLDATIPEALRELLASMLRRAPEDRPSSARVVAALEPSLVPLLAQRPEAPLIGRDDALAVLDEAFASPRASAVWLQGAPGLGKSALLRQFLATRRQTGDALVLASRCFEHESTPFKTIDGLVDGLARFLSRTTTALSPALKQHGANLARSFPALKQVSALVDAVPSASPPEAHLHESAVAFRELLHLATSSTRVVVSIDDLHWADTDSVPFLRELLEGSNPPPVLFVGALREEGHPLLESFRRAPTGDVERREVRLSPLTLAQSHHLARVLLPEGRDAEALVAEAGGNPFLLQALAGHDGGLQGAVAARVSQLPVAAQRLLETVCLAGAPLPRALWTPAAALDGDDALALGHLRAGRLVRVRRDGALEPYHDTLRRAVTAQLSDGVKTQRHERLASVLEATGGGDPELLALHLHGAGRVDDAATQAVRGAERAMAALAFHHAAELYAKALAWAPRQANARALHAARGEALAMVGRGEAAASAMLAACEGATEVERVELQRRAAAQLLRTGHIERGLELTRTVLEAHGLSLAKTPRGAVASLVWTRARLGLRGLRFKRTSHVDAAELARIDALTSSSIGLAAVDSLRAADLMGQALLRALAAGEPRRAAVCLGFETAFQGNAGGASEPRTLRVLEAADALSRELGDPYTRACALGGAGIAFFHLGRLAESRARCEAASELFTQCPGAVKEIFTNQLFSLAALAQMGDLGALRERLDGHLRLAMERGDRYAEANLRTGMPNLAWLGADDEARAREEVELAKPGLHTAGYSVQHFFQLIGKFHIELYAGDGVAAKRVFDEQISQLERSLLSRTEWILIATAWMRGRALLASGETKRSDGARRAVLDAAQRIEKRKRPWGHTLALSLRAGERRAAGDEQAALTLLEQVARQADVAELKLHAECARFLSATAKADSAAAAEARARATELGVKSIERMTQVYLPWGETPPTVAVHE